MAKILVKKILVTGGAGFIASHIVDKYIAEGHSVVVVDNLLTGKKENVNKKAKFYEVDIKDAGAINKIFAKEKPEVVNHHAAIAEVVKSLRDPIPTFDTNILGTVNLLIASQANGMKKFIFASTGGAIYGEAKKIPADEKTTEIPLSPYGFSKLLGEQCIKFYSRLENFKYLIFRYPNVYGPRQNPKGEAGVVAIFTDLLKNKKAPTIFGDGAKARDYTHVEDIVSANLAALEKGENETINLGWGKEITDQEVFNTIASALKSDIKCQHAPHRAGEVYRISLNNKKAQKVLGWKPKISFSEGIKSYVSISV